MTNTKHTPILETITNSLPALSDLPSVPRHAFTAKLTFGRQRYTELDIFRQEIEEAKAGIHHQPYTQHKKNILRYRLAFFGFALVFFILGLSAMLLPTTISISAFFDSGALIKALLVSICMLLSLSSFGIGLSMSSEREAIMKCVRKARAVANAIYMRKRARLGLNHLSIVFSHQRRQALALKHLYEEIIDRINDKKDDVLHLVQRIATAHSIDYEEKEALFNQAIEEFGEKLMTLNHNFRKETIPHYANEG